MSDETTGGIIAVVICALVLGVIALLFWGIPSYAVWAKSMRGKGDLREAEWNKRLLIEEAKAKKESATLLAEAEIERAKGVAESNKIIADGLKGNDEYLRYLYITTMSDMETQLIYVPTEAVLPILEAKR